MNAVADSAKFLVEKELAERWRLKPATLQRWRYEGHGPEFVKLRGRVLYAVATIEAFEVQHNMGRPGGCFDK